MSPVTVRAYAKINLSLRITARRPDGFHEVQTILQSIDLFDRVRCERRRGAFTVRCAVPGVPTDRDNLIWKAAERLLMAAGAGTEPRDAVVTLDKRIPMEAGLGGGSSDAAAALFGLRRLWRLAVSDDGLYDVARSLGADVPYFLTCGTALGLGRGDEIYPLVDLPRLWCVVVVPSFGVSTRDAYGWWDLKPKSAVTYVRRPSEHLRSALPWLPVEPVNDLEAVVIERHPMIGHLKRRLQHEGAILSAMSGSGSAVFGVFSSQRLAAAVATGLRRSGIDVRCVRFLPRRAGRSCP